MIGSHESEISIMLAKITLYTQLATTDEYLFYT